MKISGTISRYSPWGVKLVSGFIAKNKTIGLDELLSGITCLETNKVVPLPTFFDLDDVIVVVKEIKVLEEKTVIEHQYQRPSARIVRKGYIGRFAGLKGSRSIVLNNQYPSYKKGADYVWYPTLQTPNRNLDSTLKRLKLPNMFYDLECLSGHLELCINNRDLSLKYRERAGLVLDSIRKVIERDHTRWQYSQFSTYFKGIAIYKK